MSQIPFIDHLGDALETMISQRVTTEQEPRRRRRPRWLRPRVLAGLVVVLVGGGVATAAIVGQGSTTLVARGLSCMSGTGNGANGAYNVPQNGQSPTAACAQEMRVPAAKLVACANPKSGAVVYESNGDADQCKSLGLAPLPADYASANARVHSLQQALTSDYDRSDCMSPKQLAREVNADLQRLGFVGWRAVIDTGDASEQEYVGPCGDFPATGGAISSAAAALDAGNHTVEIGTGPPRSVQQIAERVMPVLSAGVGRCYTLTGAQRLVRDILDKAAGRTTPARFAVVRAPSDAQAMLGPQLRHYYDRGCTIVVGLGTTPDGQTFLVKLENNAAAQAPDNGNGPIPDSAYKPALTRG
jgi:hypothetical protein